MDETSFLNTLPPDRREAMVRVCAQIAAQVEGYTPQIQQYVFPADPLPGHVWEDARTVFWSAVDGFAPALRTDELPLLFVGAHAQNRLTKKRDAMGLMLTDQAVLVLNPKGVFSSNNSPVVFPLNTPFAVENAASRFEWSFMDGLFRRDQTAPDQMRAALTQVVARAAALVMPETGTAPDSGAAPAPQRQTASDIPGRIRELGLTIAVHLGDDPKQAKHLAKLGAKAGVPAGEKIIVSISDATLAGPYGTAITDMAVYSRQLMEDPVPPTPRSAIDPAQISITGSTLTVGPDEVHTLHTHLDDRERASLEIFLRELFSGQLES